VVKKERKRLYRSRKKIIGGVGGGIAEYFETDPVIIRLVLGLGSFIWGIGLFFYLAAWLIIPEQPYP